MREFAEIGLASVWLWTAQRLGYERFMALWRHLSADQSVLLDDGQILLRLRDFSYYERMQRDLYIRRLARTGLPLAEIYAQVKSQLNDGSSYTAVKKVASAAWASKRLSSYDESGLSLHLQERIRRAAHSDECPDMFPDLLDRAIKAEACKTPAAPKKGPVSDPRLLELLDIGLSASWVGIARLVGYDDFVALWRHWAADPALRNRANMIELRLRRVSAYEKYQRNRYIETLVASGLKPSEIYTMVKQELGENMSFRHLKRLAAAARVSK